jgi:hypothetical protein
MLPGVSSVLDFSTFEKGLSEIEMENENLLTTSPPPKLETKIEKQNPVNHSKKFTGRFGPDSIEKEDVKIPKN